MALTITSFFPLEHWNYLGVDENLGPVAVSLRREKLEEHKDHGQQYNYRVIFRTSEVHPVDGFYTQAAWFVDCCVRICSQLFCPFTSTYSVCSCSLWSHATFMLTNVSIFSTFCTQ